MQTETRTSTLNHTSKLIGDRGQPLLDAINRSLASKLPISRDMQLIEQHSQEYLCYVIERDAWADRITEGNTPTNNQIAGWAYRRALSEIRGWGRDAAMVEIRGARTERTRQLMDSDVLDYNPKAASEVYSKVNLNRASRGTGTFPDAGGTFREDAIGTISSNNSDPESEILDKMAYDQAMERLEEIVRRHIRSPRYVGVLRQLIDDELSVSEIAQNEQVSRNRAASILAELRKCLRSARKRGLLDAHLAS